jgi:hypothetical protein
VLGVFLDQNVNFGGAVAGGAEEIFCESLDVRPHVAPLLPEGLPNFLRTLFGHIRLKEHLQRQLSRFAAGPHGIGSGQ